MADLRPPRDVDLPEPLAELFVDYDEALAAGHATPVTEAMDSATSSMLPEPLRGAVECLDLLDRERRRRHQDGSNNGDIDTASPRTDGSITADDAAPPADEQAPAASRFGRFEIVRELGHGGQAVVFLARDPALNRLVALKVPRPDVLMTPSMRRRFLREGKAAAQLSHPNIVTVFEAGELGPICYLTQAYSPGINLADWLREHPSAPPIIAAQIVAELADGIVHAHDRGVWHRDLKPSNVLLEPRRKHVESTPGVPSPEHEQLEFVPKLTDFGLAKVLEPDGDETATGAVIGTASYMAPEQANGAPNAVGPAVDIYGLGAVLYELLTGRAVFRGSTHGATLRLVLQNEPVPPRVVRPEVPRDLEAICLRCLEKMPAKRYPSPAMLAEDLRRFLRGEPTWVRPIRPRERVWKWARRRPTAAALVCVSALAIVLLVTSTTWYSVRISRALAATKASESRMREVLYSAEIARAQQTWKRLNSDEAVEILADQLPEPGYADLRGFGWRYLWGVTHDHAGEMLGHTGDVYCVAASPDGKYWATAGKDRTARLWTADGRPRHVLCGHLDEVDFVCFAPDSRTLASSDDTGSVRLWRVDNGTMVRQLVGHEKQVSMMTFVAGGTGLVSAGHDGTIRSWDLATGELIWTHELGDLHIHSVAISPDGKRLVTASEDDYVRVWEYTPSGLNLQLEFKAEVEARCVDFVSGGKELLLGLIDGQQVLFDAETGLPIRRLGTPFTASVMAHGVDQRRGLVAVASATGSARLWDVKNRALLRSFQGQSERLWSVALAPDRPVLAAASADGTVRLWQFDERTGVPQAPGLQWNDTAKTLPQTFELSPDGSLTAIGGRKGELALYQTKDWQFKVELPPHQAMVVNACFSHDGRWLASIAVDGGVRVTEVATGKLVLDRHWPGTPLVAMFARDHQWLVIGGLDGWLEVLDTEYWALQKRLVTPAAVFHLALSRDGKTLVSPRGYMLTGWDTSTWKQTFHHEQPGHVFNHATFTPDGQLLITGEAPRTIGLRDPRTGELRSALTANDDVDCVAVSPDNLSLACIESRRRIVRLWDLRTGHELAVCDAPSAARLVKEIAFAPDGTGLYGLVGRKAMPNYIVRWRADRVDDALLKDGQRKRVP